MLSPMRIVRPFSKLYSKIITEFEKQPSWLFHCTHLLSLRSLLLIISIHTTSNTIPLQPLAGSSRLV